MTKTAEAIRETVRQVGGEHYATSSGTQHWDLFGPEYLMGYATKYMRWRKKGGVEDLRKARSVVEKLRETWASKHLHPRPEFKYRASRETVKKWCSDYGLDFVETLIVTKIMFWEGTYDLDDAIAGLDYLIEGATSIEIRRGESVSVEFAKSPVTFIADDVTFTTVSGTPEDGGQHESLWPWYLTRDYVRNQIFSDRWALMMPFYRVLGTDANHVLEPTVSGAEVVGIPLELESCYAYAVEEPAESFSRTKVVKIENVPQSVREYFPTLRREVNSKEWSDLPEWQRSLYLRTTSNDSKMVLKNPAWAAE